MMDNDHQETANLEEENEHENAAGDGDGELYETGNAGAIGDAVSPINIAVSPISVRLPSSACGDSGILSGGGVQPAPKCDDCQRVEPLRTWRWCKECERVLCETCCVEGHFNHSFESYATAVRRSDDEMRKADELISQAIRELQEEAVVAREMKEGIVATLNDIKRKDRRAIDEAIDVENTLREHVNAMIKLKGRPLNAEIWKERENHIAGLQELLKVADVKSGEVKERLKRTDGIVDQCRIEFNRIFREGV